MKTKIYLVRHTKTYGNEQRRLQGRSDFEITEEGQDYIEKLTDRLKTVKFDKIYSSTSKRAIKTVEPLAKINNLDIEKSDKLCEMSFGIYDGMTWEEVNKLNPQIDKEHKEKNEIMGIPEQETTEEVANRMYNYIRAVSIDNDGKVILMSSHGIAIESFIRKIKNEKFTERIAENSQKNTSVNIINYCKDDNKFEVELLNDISHLK